jgi:CRP/FNR family cyclic AMP-dependent transcriptional regulator
LPLPSLWLHAFDSDEVIFSFEDGSQDVYLILAGSVHITYTSASGKEVTFRDQCAGEVFGLLSAIDGQLRSAHVVALEAVTIARMSGADFASLLANQASINGRVLRHLAKLVRSLSERVTEYGTMKVNQRIYAELLRLAEEDLTNDSALINPAPTHADLASRIATHREAISRELGQLTVRGIIEKRAGDLVVKRVSELKSLMLGRV